MTVDGTAPQAGRIMGAAARTARRLATATATLTGACRRMLAWPWGSRRTSAANRQAANAEAISRGPLDAARRRRAQLQRRRDRLGLVLINIGLAVVAAGGCLLILRHVL